MNSYELSRNFTDWCFDNPHKVKPIHYAIFYFSIEHCNRLGWKENFGFPSQMVMEAIGVKNWRTYSAGLNELAEFGFIKIIEKSQNQYSSNIIAIVNFTKAHTKPLDKALSNHHTNHSQTTVSIDKQDNNKQLNNIISFNYKKCTDIEFVEELSKFKDLYTKKTLNDFYFYWSDKNEKGKMKLAMQDTFEINKRLVTWKNNEIKFGKSETLDARNPKNLPVEL
jgi:hypothetical protein